MRTLEPCILPSTTSEGESRIVRYLKQGAGVVMTRAHAHYVVTGRVRVGLGREKLEEMAYHVVQQGVVSPNKV